VLDAANDNITRLDERIKQQFTEGIKTTIAEIKCRAAKLPYRCMGEVYSLVEYLKDAGSPDPDMEKGAHEYRLWLVDAVSGEPLGSEFDSFENFTCQTLSKEEADRAMRHRVACINAGAPTGGFGLTLPSWLQELSAA